VRTLLGDLHDPSVSTSDFLQNAVRDAFRSLMVLNDTLIAHITDTLINRLVHQLVYERPFPALLVRNVDAKATIELVEIELVEGILRNGLVSKINREIDHARVRHR